MGIESEVKFFDRVASGAEVQPISQFTCERYAVARHANLFAKEKMFSLLPKSRPLRLLEIGCGEGTAAVQLAYCGIDVLGIDVSPVSIDVARRRASVQGVVAEFAVADIMSSEIGIQCFDVVWCDLILHHLIDPFDRIVKKIHSALRPGGRFIAREPVQYAHWLKGIRRCIPVRVDATPDERPLGQREVQILLKHFPHLQRRYFRISARIDRLNSWLPVIGMAARIDNILLTIPGFQALAGNAVFWADVPNCVDASR